VANCQVGAEICYRAHVWHIDQQTRAMHRKECKERRKILWVLVRCRQRAGSRPRKGVLKMKSSGFLLRWDTVETFCKSDMGRWRGSGTRFTPREDFDPHLQPMCGYVVPPTHAA